MQPWNNHDNRENKRHIVTMVTVTTIAAVCLCVSSTAGLLFRGHYSEGAVFRTTDPIGLEQCARECMLTVKCSGFNHISALLLCEFLCPKPGSTPANLIQREDSVYSDVSTWPRVSTTYSSLPSITEYYRLLPNIANCYRSRTSLW
jgi:hypothetical protein